MRQSLKQKEKRRRLLAAGRDLYGSQGFSETSVKDLVEHAGIAQGTFYLYYNNKEELLVQLRREETQKLVDLLSERLVHASLGDGLDLMIDTFFEVTKEQGTFINALHVGGETALSRAEWQEFYPQVAKVLEDWLWRVGSVDVAQFAMPIVTMLDRLTYAYLALEENNPEEARIKVRSVLDKFFYKESAVQ